MFVYSVTLSLKSISFQSTKIKGSTIDCLPRLLIPCKQSVYIKILKVTKQFLLYCKVNAKESLNLMRIYMSSVYEVQQDNIMQVSLKLN